jgi:short-subunit dehydrogenase
MLAAGEGGVLNVASTVAFQPMPYMATYGASKAALDYFAHSLMLEVRAQNVKVTTIAPGSVDTSFSGLSQWGSAPWMLTAEDLAQTVLDLLRMRDGAHSSRVEMRPARPQKR